MHTLVFATNYYVSNQGNDANPGTSAHKPWKSLHKVQQKITALKAGDRILFKRGSIFTGSLNISNLHGSSSSPIVIGAYGSGPEPVIKGAIRIGNWVRHAPNIWKAHCATCPSSLSGVYMDDEALPLGRYPNLDAANKGYLTIDQSHKYEDNRIVKDKELRKFRSNYWQGAEIVVRTRRWLLDKSTVLSHHGEIVNLTRGLTYGVHKDFGYFFQNSYYALDQHKEWYYDHKAKTIYLYLSGTNPNSHRMEVAKLNRLLSISSSSHISVSNMAFEKSNGKSISITASRHISFIDNHIRHSSVNALVADKADNFLFQRNTIDHTLNNALDYDGNHSKFLDNTISNTATVAGMGATGNGQYNAVSLRGNNILFQYNDVINTGYLGIQFKGNAHMVRNNLVDHVCMVKDDGAGIYTFDNQGSHNKVIDNIVLNAKGVPEGTDAPHYHTARGIYTDGGTSGVLFQGNTVAYSGGGMMLHVSRNITALENTLFGNHDHTLKVVYQPYTNRQETSNLQVRNNILYSGNANKEVYNMVSHTNNARKFGDIDHNTIIDPVQDALPKTTNAMLFEEKNKYPVHTPFTKSFFTYHSLQQAPYGRNDSEAPIFYPRYKVLKTLGNNLLKNSEANAPASSGDWISEGSSPGFKLIHERSSVLNGKSLKTYFSSGSANHKGFLSQQKLAMKGGAYYCLTFDVKADKASVLPFRLEDAGKNKVLTEKLFNLSSEVKNYRYIFKAPSTTSSGKLSFTLNPENGTVWFDNIKLQQVQVEEIREKDIVKLAYNASKKQKEVSLNGTYMTADGKKVSGKVSLPPYRSMVLIKVQSGLETSEEQPPRAQPAASLPWTEYFNASDKLFKGSLETEGLYNNGSLSVENGKLQAKGVGEAAWKSEVIRLNGRTADFSLVLSSKGVLESAHDHVSVFYKIDNGKETLVKTVNGAIAGYKKIQLQGLKGSSLQLVVRFKNSDISEHYFLDHVEVVAADFSDLPWSEYFNASDKLFKGSLETEGLYNNGSLSVENGKLQAKGVGEAAWKSEVIRLNGRTADFSLVLSSKGVLESAHDHISVFYKIDNGKEILAREAKGKINGYKKVIVRDLKGSTLQIVVRFKNSDISEHYFLDHVEVVASATHARVDGQSKKAAHENPISEDTEKERQPLALEVSPNPAVSWVEVRFSHTEQQTVLLTLLDMTGRKVLERSFSSSEEISLDVSSLRPGIYVLQLMDAAGQLHSRRIIKQ